jgi:hypothetical protein
MGTPREVNDLIDALAYDVYDAYDNPRLYPAPEKAKALTAARYLARKLVRKGWRKSDAAELPRCPYGTVTCFDPEPHAHCEM